MAEISQGGLTQEQKLARIDAAMEQMRAIFKPNVEKVIELLGTRYIGPESWMIYFSAEVKAEPLPRKIVKVLESACPFEADKKISETHILIYVPDKLNNQPLTANKFAELANDCEARQVKEPVIWQGNVNANYRKSAVYNQATSKGEWLLVPTVLLPQSFKLPYEHATANSQLKVLESFKEQTGCADYEVAGARELAIALGMCFIQSGERLYKNVDYGYCKDLIYDSNNNVLGRAAVGFFISDGLHLFYYEGGPKSPVGLALFRKLL